MVPDGLRTRAFVRELLKLNDDAFTLGVAMVFNRGAGRALNEHPGKLPEELCFMAKELQDVMRCVLHLAIHYGIQAELATSVDESYRRMVQERLIEPAARDESRES